MTKPETPRLSARERLLAAADELFYEEGVNTVGIDRVIERAGVAKASLYSLFGSKDELIRAYLEQRHARRKQRIQDGLARYDTPREQLLGLFDVLGEIYARPGSRGCAFINAGVEAQPGGVIDQATREYRGWLETLFTDLARKAGASDPDGLATQLMLLYDGASVSARLAGGPHAAQAAKAAAKALLDAALLDAVDTEPLDAPRV
jgi:AcrR family transcriptional regulator